VHFVLFVCNHTLFYLVPKVLKNVRLDEIEISVRFTNFQQLNMVQNDIQDASITEPN